MKCRICGESPNFTGTLILCMDCYDEWKNLQLAILKVRSTILDTSRNRRLKNLDESITAVMKQSR